MNLSKAQQKVMDRAKAKIDFTRSHSLKEWAEYELGYTKERVEWMIERSTNYGMTRDEMRYYIQDRVSIYMREYEIYYMEEKAGEVLVTANSRTLRSLESLGLIEVIFDGGPYTDRIRVLNY